MWTSTSSDWRACAAGAPSSWAGTTSIGSTLAPAPSCLLRAPRAKLGLRHLGLLQRERDPGVVARLAGLGHVAVVPAARRLLEDRELCLQRFTAQVDRFG